MYAMSGNERRMVVVTGADGFLGANLVRALLSRGHPVRALLQPGRATGTLDGLGIERVEGELLDPPSLLPFLRDAAAVIFGPGSLPLRRPRRASRMVRVAASMARTARDSGVGSFVFVGTADAFAAGDAARPGDESRRSARPDAAARAQDLVLAMNAPGFRVVVAAPTVMFGPHDPGPGPGALLLAVANRELPGSPPGGGCFAAARDVARGIVLAMERGRPGECYILGGENLSYARLLAKMAEVCRVEPPSPVLPVPAVLLAGALSALALAPEARLPLPGWTLARLSCRTRFYASDKAVRELGYAMRPVEEDLQAARVWFRDRGML